MENYKLRIQGDTTIIQLQKPALKMSVQQNRSIAADSGTAHMEVTLYKEDGVFVRQGTYIFEALGDDDAPLFIADADELKQAVDFYCTFILGTQHYVKDIPRSSGLCPPKNERLNLN